MTPEGRRHSDLRARQPRAIQSALAVLEVVARRGPGTTAHDISADLAMPRTTTYRIVKLLEQEEYLIRLPDLRGFALGRKVQEMAGPWVQQRAPQAVRSELEALRQVIRAGVHLLRFDRQQLVVLDEDGGYPLPGDLLRVDRVGLDPVGLLLLLRHAGTPPSETGFAASLSAAGVTAVADAWPHVLRLSADGYARATGQCAGQNGFAVAIHGPTGELEAGLAALFPGDLPVRHREILLSLRDGAQRLTPLLT